MTRPRIHPAPFAVAADGSVLANVTLVDGAEDATSAIRTALELGGRVFVGVELREGEVTDLHRWVQDAAYESLAFILGGRRTRKRRRRVRRSRHGAP